MLRCASRKHPLPSSRAAYRYFHSSSKRNTQSIEVVNDAVAEIATRSPALHDLFPLIHDLTSLPWLISIPLTTILVRSLVTPIRYYFAACRRDQRLAAPKLLTAANIIAKQAAVRKASGLFDIPQRNAWIMKHWYARRGEIMKRHPRAEPSYLLSTNSNLDISNLVSMALVAVNTSTIMSQSIKIPDLIEFDALEGLEVGLCSGFFILAILNTMHYYGNPFVRHSEPIQGHKSIWSLVRWTEDDSRASFVIGMPFIVGIMLSFCPQPVILSVLSNSVYSFLERKTIYRLAHVPPYELASFTKSAAQHTVPQKVSRQLG